MNIFGLNISRAEKPAQTLPEPATEQIQVISPEQPVHRGRVQASAFYGNNTGGYAATWTVPFNGEKNVGELGPVINYVIDHQSLRARSWQMYLESEICLTAIGSFVAWIVGSGLRLQSEPVKAVLAAEKITLDTQVFSKAVEARFMVWASSTEPDIAGQTNLHGIARKQKRDSIVGGDCLIVARVIKGELKIQLIDGAHLGTPYTSTPDMSGYRNPDNNNLIRDGVEIDGNGRHVAYHVRKAYPLLEYERILAYGPKTGMRMAWLSYGLAYRLSSERGLPLITAIMETAKKIERYKEATVGSAEERQKISFFVEHDATSDGEDPLIERLRNSQGYNNDGLPGEFDGEALAGKVYSSTNKTTINMPRGATIKQLESDNEANFGAFMQPNIDLICATIRIPPDVAMGKYTSNYSASRAAIKGWEHTVDIERQDESDQFYGPIFALWLDLQVYSRKIEAPGYLEALKGGNYMAINAYRNARFIGANVPHIDPYKEVMAVRAKLGGKGANLPLTTAEAATAELGGGDFDSNRDQFAQELDTTEELGIEPSGEIPEVEDPTEEKDK